MNIIRLWLVQKCAHDNAIASITLELENKSDEGMGLC